MDLGVFRYKTTAHKRARFHLKLLLNVERLEHLTETAGERTCPCGRAEYRDLTAKKHGNFQVASFVICKSCAK